MRQALVALPQRQRSDVASDGTIAAGRPVEAMENPETDFAGDFTRSKDVYVLQVTGESMQDEHIVNGDYVLVEKTNVARDGEIVVALVNGSDATLKRMFRRGQDPAAAVEFAMQPIVVPAASVQIQGRVIGVLAEVLKSRRRTNRADRLPR